MHRLSSADVGAGSHDDAPASGRQLIAQTKHRAGFSSTSHQSNDVLAFDSQAKQLNAANIEGLKAVLKALRGYANGYLLTSVSFSRFGDSVAQIMVDFDGVATLSKGNGKQGDEWILEGMKQYLKVCSQVGSEIEVDPENKPGVPKWMKNIYMERRWDNGLL